MNNSVDGYIAHISVKYSHPETSEMGYRTDFEVLLKALFESINVTRFDHDAKAKQGNKPDFVVVKNDVPILYIETKDIGISLDKVEKSEQMSRYFGYENLVLTDYLEFRFYRNGLAYGEAITIGEFDAINRTITPLPQNFDSLATTLIDFTQSHKESIKSGKHLAKIMGGKALRIRDNVRHLLDKSQTKDQELSKLFDSIKSLLVHDLTIDTFSDLYAQTLVYGLFVARFYDETPHNFTRSEARELIPNSNKFLKHFFDHIVGVEFKSSLRFIVDELCEVYSYADVSKLMDDYYKVSSDTDKTYDPVIHFYEDFLNEYDPVLRKKMGAYYTPQPVVDFIASSVDALLKKEFGLVNGIADTTKLVNGKHKVQILDPATGTGTFISTVIRDIYKQFVDQKQQGQWPTYVHRDLLPRIHGFELMMAAYTIAHLRLGIAFRKSGFWDFRQRLGIYLTNSLEESVEQNNLFAFGLAESIAQESKEANIIKNETPIMVVIGNPPYSVSSSNKGKWIQNLIQDYKRDLDEKNIQPLSDDYIKFIRFSEHFVAKNKSGIVAMITNNSFLDGIIHRQMRKHLLETFDDIYILDLHGNAKKKETAPDSSTDQNVFDIQQGVSINIFVKHEAQNNEFATVHHAELCGKREHKFNELNANNIETIKWTDLDYTEPYYFFVPKDFESIGEYEKGFKVDDLMQVNSSGIKTHRDAFVIDFDKDILRSRVKDFANPELSESEITNKYKLKETTSFNIAKSRKLVSLEDIDSNLKRIAYRPFDDRWIYYSPNLVDRDRRETMKNIEKENLLLVTCKQQSSFDFQHIFVSKNLVDMCTVSSQTKETGYAFSLYLFQEDGSKTPNFNLQIIERIKQIVGEFTPEDLFDYMYAVLHSPSYREKFKEFLKIDFPRVPYPQDTTTFKKLVALGTKLRELHLLESPTVNQFITTYPIQGTDIVDKPLYEDENVYINETQYVGNVPKVAWNFYIGGYQPAQKWLKDRNGRTLTNEDIEHYQQMIVALTETNRIMKEIDAVFHC